ncbi:HIS6p Enzyme that catalyzes the fourth step in the histidine pathway [Saccharomyces cerevisiae]|nr:HIS6p Enzyme that catalyzes the fourth step in the histidine pathway [Saccharomyces boulardii (nom. inval.)]
MSKGCHVIKLGPNNDDAAREALQESPQFLQVGGGINDTNCLEWLKWASKTLKVLCGIDELLVSKLFEWTKDYDDLKIVYAGGAKSVDDLKLVDELSHGKVDLTFGSSLDIFGGNLVKFEDCCRWNEKQG